VSSEDLTISINAVDNASATLAVVDKNLDQVGVTAKTTAAAVTTSTGSVTGLVGGFGLLATTGASAVLTFESMQRSEVLLDRSNVMVEKSTRTVTSAQDAYNTAVEKYGADSPQALTAANNLKIAQDALAVSNERQGLAQMSVNDAQMRMATTVIPLALSAITSISTISKHWSVVTDAVTLAKNSEIVATISETASTITSTGVKGANSVATIAMSAATTVYTTVAGIATTVTAGLSAVMMFLALNPIVLVIAAVAALVIGLKYLYDNNETVRTGINNLIAVISGSFTAALNAIKTVWDTLTKGIQTDWNTYVQPLIAIITGFGTSIINVFQGVWKAIVGGSSWTALCSGLGTIWTNFAAPVLTAITGWATSIGNVFSGLQTALGNIWNGITTTASNVFSAVTATISNAVKAINSAVASTGASTVTSTSTAAVSGTATGTAQKPGEFDYGTTTTTTTTPAPVTKTTASSGGNSAGVKAMASGFEGIITKPMLALMGESGPERVSVKPTSQGGGSGVIINISFPNVLTMPENPETIRRLFAPAFKQLQLDLQRVRT